jgi:hypothetical protein
MNEVNNFDLNNVLKKQLIENEIIGSNFLNL